MVGNEVHLMQKCFSCIVYISISAQNLHVLVKVLNTVKCTNTSSFNFKWEKSNKLTNILEIKVFTIYHFLFSVVGWQDIRASLDINTNI